ncbi:MAG: DUF5668 domain-containing protein [Bryobacteraceae bacterium]|jgi:hypothetical protein
MKGERNVFRAIRGPVTLITVGGLFALQNFTPYDFGQTWPVLLIVFGLLSLLSRTAGPPPPPPPPPPQYAWQPPAWQGQPWQPPAPASAEQPAGGYRATSYAQPPAGAEPAASSAPRNPDATPENSTPGGAV